MIKSTAVFGVLLVSRSLTTAQSGLFTQGNLSFLTSTSLSSTLTLPPFPISNTTTSSVSLPIVGSGKFSSPSQIAANSTATNSRATGPATTTSNSFGASRGASTSSQNVGTASRGDQSPANNSSQPLSHNSDGSLPTAVTASESSSTGSKVFSSASILVPGNGVLPFPTTTSPASRSDDQPVAASFLGAWKDTSMLSPASFTWFNIPTMTISDAPEETSESKLLGGLFFAVRANRKWLQDSNLKDQYLDNVKKTQEEITALLSKLPITPPKVPGCSPGKRKRSSLSEIQLRALLRNRGIIPEIGKAIKSAIGDIGKLISCADDVVTKLTKTIEGVEENTPDLGEIEDLTDTLAEIGKDLEEENENEESSSTSQQSSTTSEGSSSSSSSSCTGSTAVPICTEIVSLSTSFMPGATSSFAVTTITQTTCVTTTIAGCTATGTTTTAVGSTSSGSSTLISAVQDIEYYSSVDGSVVSSRVSEIKSELASLGCVTNWNQPNPTEACDLSGLNATTRTSSVSAPATLGSIGSSSPSVTGFLSGSSLSSLSKTSSIPFNSASVTSLNVNSSISSTQSVDKATSTSASVSVFTSAASGSSFGIHSTIIGSSSTTGQKETTFASPNSDASPTFASSTSISAQISTKSTSLISNANPTIVDPTSTSGQVEINSMSSVSNPNPTVIGSTSTFGQGESTSTSLGLNSSPTVISSISSSDRGETTSTLSLSGATSILVSSSLASTSPKTASQSSSTGVPSTLVTVPSITNSLSSTLPTPSSTSSQLGTSVSSSQTISSDTKSATLSTAQTSSSTSQSPLTSTSTPSSTKTEPPLPPPTRSPPNCRGLDNANWIPCDRMANGITSFCTAAAAVNKHDDNSGSLALTFWKGTPNVTDFWIDWPANLSIQKDECITSMTSIMDNCDGVPANPSNYKHGGSITYGAFTYHIQPTLTRRYVEGRCSVRVTAEDKRNEWLGGRLVGQ